MSQSIRTTFTKYIEEEISRDELFSDTNLQTSLSVDFIAWVRLAEETYLVSEPLGNMHDWLGIQGAQIKELSEYMANQNLSQRKQLKLVQSMVQSLYFR
jgi:hypothetical protein